VESDRFAQSQRQSARLCSGDFNRDGNLDVVMERSFGGGLGMWLGDGGNTWTSCPITQTPGAQAGQYDSLVVGQFDHAFQEPDVIAARDDGLGSTTLANGARIALTGIPATPSQQPARGAH